MKNLLLILVIGNLNLISGFSIALPLAIGLIKLKSLGREFGLVFVFIIISFAVEIITDIMSINRHNNLWLGNIFFLLECFFWSVIIRRWLETRKIRLFILIFLAAYLVFWGFTTFFVLDFYKFNSYARAIESFVFVFLSCFLLIAVSTDTTQVIFKNPKFWFGSALLIYFSVNLIVFGTVNYISSNQGQLMNNTWMIHSVTNIFANLLFGVGFLCIRKKAI
jgi:hypothetical protein